MRNMNIYKKTMNHKILALAGLSCAVFQTSCKLPPGEVLRGMQREGLVGYFAKDHVEKDIVVSEISDAPEGSREITETVNPANERSPFVSSGGDRHLAIPISGRPGFVYSPHSSQKLLVDVSEFAPGSRVMCPYTNKPFVVPSSSTNNVATSIRRESPNTKPVYPNMDRPKNTVSTPPVKKSNTSVSSKPKISASTPESITPKSDDGAIPYAKRIDGRPSYVYSPYASKSQIVDVSGMSPGAKVRCPYTGKLFLVPAAAKGSTPAPAPVKKEEPKPAAKPEPKKETPQPAPVKETPKTAPKPEPKKEEPKPSEIPAPKKEEPKPAPTPKKDEGIKDSGNGSGATPTAAWADGKDGYVVSPFGNFLVDVRGKAAGGQMRCPFSGKLFKIPSK